MRYDKVVKFLSEARLLASCLSKDTSTKVGAGLFDPQDFTQTTYGYNGIPRGLNDADPAKHQRPLKYSYFEHAERNALYNLARKTLKGSVVLSTNPVPPIGCVRAVVSVGASEIWLPADGMLEGDAFCVGDSLFREAGVTVYRYDPLTFEQKQVTGLPFCPDEQHTRKVMQYLAFLSSLPALLSKDTSPEAALFLSREDFTLLARGYSGMPRGAKDDAEERYHAPLRDLWIEGAIRNAVFNMLRPQLKGNVALVTATTCAECVRALANVGVTEIHYLEPAADFKERWGSSIDIALRMMDELGIVHQEVPVSDLSGSV